MLITEYRIPLPLTVQEYQVGQLYSTIEMSKRETGGGEGVEVLQNEPFHNFPIFNGEFGDGQYTYKIYHMAKKVPAFVRHLTPHGSLELHEEAWNAYPYGKTELRNPSFMKDGFSIGVLSHHFNDKGEQENVHKLPPELLKKRNVVYVDIVNDPMAETFGKLDNDPTTFKSTKTGRGPFVGQWVDTANPIMTCYKLVTAEFKWFGLQTRVEKLIQATERKLFFLFHRMLICSMDDWYSLSLDEVRNIERQGAVELHKNRLEGTVKDSKIWELLV